MSIFDRKFFDYLIAPSGGDNSSIAAGLAAAGTGAKIAIIGGSYTETADIEILSQQQLYVFGIATGTSTHQLKSTADGWGFHMGFLNFQTSYSGYLVDFTGCDNVVAEGGIIGSSFTGSQATADNHSSFLLSTVDNSRFNLYSPPDSYSLQDTSWDALGLYCFDVDNSFIKYANGGLTVADSAAAGTVGLQIQVCDFSDFDVNIINVTTTSGNDGVGVKVTAASTYNSIRGVSRGCDSANISNGGTGTNSAGLAT